MSKVTQLIIVVLIVVMTTFSILSFYKLREIRNHTMMTEAWVTNIGYDIEEIRRDMNDFSIIGAGGSSDFPNNVANLIDEIADTVIAIDTKFKSFEGRYNDFTRLYLQKNF